MNKMKKYNVKYFCHIIKDTRETKIYAETKTKAKKKFKDSYHQPPTILDVEEIK